CAGVRHARAGGPDGGVHHPPKSPANRATLPPTGIAPEVGQIVNNRGCVCSVAQDTLFRSSPRGAPRDARVAGTPLRGPSPQPWIPAFAGVLLQQAAENGVFRPLSSDLTPVQ